MAYNVATVIAGEFEADGRLHLLIRYTGNAGELPIDLPFYLGQGTAPGNDLVRGAAMNTLAILNTSLTTRNSFTLPLVLDTTTPLPTATPPKVLTTYMAASAPFTPGATPQDVFTITGSATKAVTIVRAGISTTQTTAGVNTWHLLRRSTANSAGTSAAVTAVPTDDDFAAATATVLQYTANPTAGILVGRVWTGRLSSPLVTTAGAGNPIIEVPTSDGRSGGQPLVLTGTGDVLAWNFNGVALPAGLSVTAYVWWTEQ